ncbi:MAG: DUF2752 domain-containing protein [Verrucomicrobiales bacterium]|nr:DUF2752 domain-containing protein [Verrucomicrobiales bacterium]
MSKATRISVSVAVFLIGIIAAFNLRRDNLADGVSWLPKCSLNQLTGLYCPGCGNTRATQALLNGDLAAAWQQNAAFVLAIPFLTWGAGRLWFAWVFPGRLKPLRFDWKYGYSVILIVLVILFGVMRNFPQKPFSWLAPVPLSSVGDEGS